MPETVMHMAARADIRKVLASPAIVITGMTCRGIFCTVHTKGCCASPLCTGESHSYIEIHIASSEEACFCVYPSAVENKSSCRG